MNLKDKVNQLARTTPFTEDAIAGSIMSNVKNGLPPLDLQFFGGKGGDEGAGEGAEGEGANEGNEGSEGSNKLELTQKELDKRIEAEADRKLNSALEKKQSEWKKEQYKAIQEALAEKERLSKLSEKERNDEELSKREKELEERLETIERKELLTDAAGDLKEKGLPTSFANLLLGEDAEKTLENINSFKTAFDEAVNAAVKEKLRQDTPPAGGGSAGKGTHTIAELRNKQEQKENKAPDLWA